MSIVLVGSTSGSITLQEPAIAGSSTINLPVGTGTAVVNGVNSSIVSGTAVASTSGTSIDFTSIPSWVRRVTVMLNGVSWDNTNSPLIQLGDSGGIETTGYNCITGGTSTGAASSGFNTTIGFNLFGGWSAADIFYGSIIISLLNVSTNTWAAQGNFSVDTSSSDWAVFTSGTKSLSATLDRVRITTTQSANFDAGTINILYE
jgi:hypothetical protein